MKITASKLSEQDRHTGYWFRLRHGLGPGTLPKDVVILDSVEDGWKDYVELNRFLTTEELNYYDIKEERPVDSCDGITCKTAEESKLQKIKRAGKHDEKRSNKISKGFDDLQDEMFSKHARLLKYGQDNVASATNTCNGFAADMSNCLASETSYDFGGAFDIEPDMFFTREEIDEFSTEVADELSAEFDGLADVHMSECYMNSTTELCTDFVVYVGDEEMECEGSVDIDFRRIQKPSDLMKYKEEMKSQVRQDIQSFVESIQEEF